MGGRIPVVRGFRTDLNSKACDLTENTIDQCGVTTTFESRPRSNDKAAWTCTKANFIPQASTTTKSSEFAISVSSVKCWIFIEWADRRLCLLYIQVRTLAAECISDAGFVLPVQLPDPTLHPVTLKAIKISCSQPGTRVLVLVLIAVFHRRGIRRGVRGFHLILTPLLACGYVRLPRISANFHHGHGSVSGRSVSPS